MYITRDSELWICINSRVDYTTFQCKNIFGFKMLLVTENIDFISLIDSIRPNLLKKLIFKVHITSKVDIETAYIMPNKNNLNTIISLIDIKDTKTYISITIDQLKYEFTDYKSSLKTEKISAH